MPRYRKQLLEVREHLYDTEAILNAVEDRITPAYIAFLKQTQAEEGRPFAFALERQSEGKIATGDPKETGHIGRVAAIQQLASDHGLYLPAPRKREDRAKGEPPFIFDERFWFVDGEYERATGFSFSPEVRPRLWFAYTMIRRINELDPGALPAALVLADVLRLTRVDQWLATWVDAIKQEGVDLIVPGTGRVDRRQLTALAISIRAQSEHLPGYRQRAMEAAFRDGRVLWKRCRKFGLTFNEEGTRVFAHPEEWSVISQVIHGLASGRFPSVMAAARWTRATYGEQLTCSEALIRSWLKPDTLLDGYYIAHDQEYKRCKIKQEQGPLLELSFTKGSNPRYIKERRPEQEWLRLPIEHSHGTTPLPPEIVEAARKAPRPKGKSVNGKPSPISAQCIAPGRLLRCAHCGYPLREQAPHPDPPRVGRKNQIASYRRWVLQCTCASILQRLRSIKNEEARKLPQTQHRRYLQASLTLPLKALLKERLFDSAIAAPQDRADAPSDLWEERVRVEERRKLHHQQLAQLIANLGVLDLKTMPDVRAQVEQQASDLQSQITECDTRLQHLGAVALQSTRETQQALWEARQHYQAMIAERWDDANFWRAIVDTFVEKILVDLEAATFTVFCRLKHDPLRTLSGELLRTNGT